MGIAPNDTMIERFYDTFVFPCFGDGETLDGVLDHWHDTTVPYASQRANRWKMRRSKTSSIPHKMA